MVQNCLSLLATVGVEASVSDPGFCKHLAIGSFVKRHSFLITAEEGFIRGFDSIPMFLS